MCTDHGKKFMLLVGHDRLREPEMAPKAACLLATATANMCQGPYGEVWFAEGLGDAQAADAVTACV